MKVEDNSLVALKNFFFAELEEQYGTAECSQFFKLSSEIYLGIPFNKVLRENIRVTESELLMFFGLIKRLKKFEPIQYILNSCYFYDLPLYVAPGVLIPRPETEELVHWVLSDFPILQSALDLCSGSGCIPLALKKSRPNASVLGIEISPDALRISKKNSELLSIAVDFRSADILNFKPLPDRFEVITSNPPYILQEEKKDMSSNVLLYEPEIALFAEDHDPFSFYKSIAYIAYTHLVPGGNLYVEINKNYPTEVVEIFQRAGLSDIIVKNDTSNLPRMVRATKL